MRQCIQRKDKRFSYDLHAGSSFQKKYGKRKKYIDFLSLTLYQSCTISKFTWNSNEQWSKMLICMIMSICLISALTKPIIDSICTHFLQNDFKHQHYWWETIYNILSNNFQQNFWLVFAFSFHEWSKISWNKNQNQWYI